MQEAKRCRAQAELCLQIARLISDPAVADQLHMKAADYTRQLSLNGSRLALSTADEGGRAESILDGIENRGAGDGTRGNDGRAGQGQRFPLLEQAEAYYKLAVKRAHQLNVQLSPRAEDSD